MADTERKNSAARTPGYVGIILLGILLLLHHFADRIWEEEPALLKWAVIGVGCLILLGLIGSLIFGTRDERIYALVFLAVVALAAMFLPSSSERRTDAAVQTLLKDLAEHETTLKRQTDALPVIDDKTSRAELNEKLTRVVEQLREQGESSQELARRTKELMARAPADRQKQLLQGLERLTAQARQSSEQRDAWIQQVREKVKGTPQGKTGDAPQ